MRGVRPLPVEPVAEHPELPSSVVEHWESSLHLMLKQREYFLFLEPLDTLELRGDELPPLSSEETLMLHEPSFLVFSEHLTVTEARSRSGTRRIGTSSPPP